MYGRRLANAAISLTCTPSARQTKLNDGQVREDATTSATTAVCTTNVTSSIGARGVGTTSSSVHHPTQQRWPPGGLTPAQATSCKFGIKVTSYVRSDVDPIARENYEKQVIREAIPPYLRGVVQGVAYYAETGDPVKRNQFGAHDIYSPEDPAPR